MYQVRREAGFLSKRSTERVNLKLIEQWESNFGNWPRDTTFSDPFDHEPLPKLPILRLLFLLVTTIQFNGSNSYPSLHAPDENPFETSSNVRVYETVELVIPRRTECRIRRDTH